jgi:hypothetical protein
MSRKTLYIISGAADFMFATSFMFVPVFFWGLYGASAGTLAIWIGRLMAVIIYGNVYMLWNLRDAPDSSKEARWFSQRMVWDWALIGIFLTIMTMQDLINFLGWITVGLCVVFTILYALDSFKK